MHMLGVPLVFIGMVLILNAIWLQGKVETRDVGVFNVLVGAIAILSSMLFGFKDGSVALSGGVTLFALTYLWVGINAIRGAEDQRALGYYCLLVAIVTLPFAYRAFVDGTPGWTFEWLSYGALWFLFYVVLTLGNTKVMGITIALTYFVGIEVLFTGWLYLYDFNLPVAQALGLAAAGG